MTLKKNHVWNLPINTHYIHSLSNISIKTNNKGRNKINKFVQYSEGDYILCMTSRLFVAVHSIATLYVNVAHIDMFFPAFQ